MTAISASSKACRNERWNMVRYHDIFETAAGWMAAVAGERGIIRLTLPRATAAEAVRIAGIDEQMSTAYPELFSDLAGRLRLYFRGRAVPFNDPLDLSGGTGFQRAVWQATARIPYGATATYGQIAALINRDRSARAVGQALGQNPLPIIIPCHRVVGSAGRLGGFGGGIEMKRLLLRLENGVGVA
jgi:methylated-DNA-[protein]-cysteine S-methyltransferase